MGKRSLVILAFLIAAAIAAGGCENGWAVSKTSIYANPAKIAAAGDSYTFADRQGAAEATGGTLSYRGFSGMNTLWRIDHPAEASGKLAVDCKLKTSKGKSKLVYIAPDGKVQVLAEDNYEGKIDLTVAKGAGRIKLVGQNAKGSLEVRLAAGDGVTIEAEGNME